MGRPYSLDLRERVVAAVASAHYDIGVSTAIRWTDRQQKTGSPAALPMGGKRPFSLAAERAWRLAEKPDITLRALLAELRARGIMVSYYAVWHFVHHAGLSFKKKPSRARARAARRCAAAGAMEAVSAQS